MASRGSGYEEEEEEESPEDMARMLALVREAAFRSVSLF
jgi:hypothetical protein